MDEGVAIIEARTYDHRFKKEGPVYVDPPPAIDVQPQASTMNIGDEITLEALDEFGGTYYCEQRSADGLETTQVPVSWNSLNPAIANVDPQTGQVQAIASGQAEIQATSGSAIGSTIVIVAEEPCNNQWAYIDVDPPSQVEILRGESILLAAAVMVYDPTVQDWIPSDCLGSNFLWDSSDEQIATVTQWGLVTGISAGITGINVELSGNPNINGGKSVRVYHSLCDKDGDGNVDNDMLEWSGLCCQPIPCTGGCELPSDFQQYFGLTECPCGPCGDNYWVGIVCKTGERRSASCTSDPGVTWGDLGPGEGGVGPLGLMVMGNKSTKLYNIDKQVRTITQSEVNLDSLIKEFKLNTKAALNLMTVENGVVIETILPNLGEKERIEAEVPTQFTLEQNYPNPFNSSTVISYQLPVESNVTIKVFDGLGKEVEILVNEKKPAGYHEVKFEGSELTSGTYFYRIQAGEFVDVKKMVLMK
jgi:hypothetical protein